MYKSAEAIGVRLHNVDCKLNILAIPFGDYIATDTGIKCGTVSWRRTADLSIPSRAKVVGSYVNPAFSKTEAMLNGYDEAIVLTNDGKVSEGSAENLFMVRRGKLVTPGVDQDILEGSPAPASSSSPSGSWASTRSSGPSTGASCTSPTRSSCAAPGAQISPVTSIDHRPVGSGAIGPVTAGLSKAYFDAVRGRQPRLRGLADARSTDPRRAGAAPRDAARSRPGRSDRVRVAGSASGVLRCRPRPRCPPPVQGPPR